MTKTQTQRTKRKRGRPPKPPSERRYNVSIRLTRREKEIYTRAGNGDLSRGIRMALSIAGDPASWPPLASWNGYEVD